MNHPIFRSSAAAVILAVLLVAVAGQEARPEVVRPTPAPDVKAVAETNNRFALDLYGKLKKGDENLFYSPYSISTALA
ncbi:MAG: serpin family protein, partial [Phycisphaerae bacterium]